MLKDNLKALRKSKGLTQEEFASRLHVVRQTVSKWESGQSAPDAETLLRIGEIMDVPVSDLLGETLPSAEPDAAAVLAEKLSVVTEQLSREAERKRRFRRAVSVAALVLVLAFALWAALTLFSLHGLAPVPESQIIGGADGPTSVFVSVRVYPAELAILALVQVLAVAGIATSKKDP